MDRPVPSPLDDVSPADWLLEDLVEFGGRVRDVVPARFEAFARVLHQAARGEGVPVPGLWTEVATYCGTTLHPLAQYQMLSGLQARSVATRTWPEQNAPEPDVGDLDGHSLTVLRDVLAAYTTTPGQCWFAMWDGWGHQPRAWRTASTFRPPHRGHFLFGGALADVVEMSDEIGRAWHADPSPPGSSASNSIAAFSTGAAQQDSRLADRPVAISRAQSPSLWWPEDRAWCVATEIDFDSTLVAGSVALVAELVASPDLEAFEVQPDDSLQLDGDRINMR